MSLCWAAVITAAGSSSRMGDGAKKELAFIAGKPVLHQTVTRFLEIAEITHIIITARKEDFEQYADVLSSMDTTATVTIVEGGGTRQQSVLLGLEALEAYTPTHVLIHDGARPWISAELIRAVMRGTVEHDACIPALPSTNAVKRVRDDVCIEHVDRNEIFNAQTPQGFNYDMILSAHRKSAETHVYTDDAEVYATQGGAVHITKGDPENRKITHPHDLRNS